MSRAKGKGNLKTFIFTVDANDPKYTDLINYLESIDNGARSYVIRQILNSYMGNQCVAVPPMNMQTTPVIEKKEETIVKTETNITPPTKPIRPKTFNKPTPKQETEIQSPPQPKEKPSEGMSKLMENFQ